MKPHPPKPKANMNQCDGCMAGYPVDKNGNHIVPYPSGSMGCQRDKYETPKKRGTFNAGGSLGHKATPTKNLGFVK